MKHSSFFLMSLGIALLFSCKSNKYDVDNLPVEQLHFGTSGGYAGITSTYVLLKNGQLFYQASASTAVEKKEPRKKKVGKHHFEKAAKINWDQLPKTEPGNMNYFIAWNKGEKKYRYTWSNKNPDESMAKWFEALNQMAK